MGQVTITLNGRGYRLNCGPGEEARLHELAADLNQRLERLAMDFGQQPDDRLLVMAALLLTDELLELKARLGDCEAHASLTPSEPEPASKAEAEKPGGPETCESDRSARVEAVAREVKAQVAGDPAAGRGRPGPQRMTLEARLAEARAGRGSSVQKPRSA